MFSDFLIPFAAISLAEFGDKTQLAIFCLASKTKNYLQLLIGVILAFILADGLAILLGEIISNIIPLIYLKLCAGAIFVMFGIFTFINLNNKEKLVCNMKTPFLSGFGLILLLEMGDKTQFASGLFATEYNPIMVFFGVITALLIMSMMTIYLGNYLLKHFEKKIISLFAGILFLVIGLWTLISAILF